MLQVVFCDLVSAGAAAAAIGRSQNVIFHLLCVENLEDPWQRFVGEANSLYGFNVSG